MLKIPYAEVGRHVAPPNNREAHALTDGEQIELISALLNDKGELVKIPLRGGSMRPWILSGDVICIQPLKRSPRPGMVVMVLFKGYLLVHRVIRVNRTGWICTRGDASLRSDPWHPPHEILGEVTQVVHRFGLTIDVNQPPFGRLAVQCAPFFGLGFAAVDLVRWVRRRLTA